MPKPDQNDIDAARLRVLAARIIAEGLWPYVATLLYSLRLVPVWDKDMKTMAVDAHWRMYYDIEFVLKFTPEELASVLLHECLHCVFDHCSRFDAVSGAGEGKQGSDLVLEPRYKFEIWNIAGDCSINHTILESGIALQEHSPGVQYKDYPTLNIGPHQTTEATFIEMLRGVVTIEIDTHDCGSIADGQRREYELPVDDPDAPGADRTELDRARDAVASAVIAAGNAPSDLARWAQEVMAPTIDWRRQLAVKIRAAVANVAGRRDYSFMRPSRRQQAVRMTGSDVVLPAMRQPGPPRVAVVADTSGSISEPDLNLFLGEMSGMLRSVGVATGLTLLACDTEVHTITRVRSTGALPQIEFVGGGGTNMGQGIVTALEIRPKPHVVVVLTDGYTPWPEFNPDTSIHYITVLTTPHTSDHVPDWMSKVVISQT